MHRFRYCDLASRQAGDRISLSKDENNHLFKILRAETGDRIGLFDGKGYSAHGRILPGKFVEIESLELIPEPDLKIHLYIAPPRKQKMDLILKQAVELGVWRIVPMICSRSVALPDKDSVGGERREDLLFEACKQSGNPYLPHSAGPFKFKDALNDAKENCCLNFYGSPRGASSRTGFPTSADISFFVGPEGGFTDEEESLMNDAGFLTLRIGAWTLRVETATVAGLALLSKLR